MAQPNSENPILLPPGLSVPESDLPEKLSPSEDALGISMSKKNEKDAGGNVVVEEMPKSNPVSLAAVDSSSEGVNSKPPKTAQQKRTATIQLITLSHVLFNLGWNDGTPGPMLPRLQTVYNFGYTVVSMVFVMSCAGFVTGAVLNIWLASRFPLGKIMAVGALLQIVAYAVQSSAPPFPAFIVMNFLNGLGLALQDAHANAFIGSSSENVETKMGVVQAFYGLGAFTSALVSTQFANLDRWSFHYLVSLGFAIINCGLVFIIFRGRSREECLREAGEDVVDGRLNGEGTRAFKDIMKSPTVHALATFLFLYVGVEIAIGGWITTFILEERNGDANAGYIASGYFGALALGRLVLLPINAWCGERFVVFYYSIISFALEFVVWFVPSLVGNGVAVAFIGLFMGPMYPIAMNQASRVLPKRILTGSIGWVASFGQAGSAVVPFVTGAISQKHGIWTMNPVTVALTGAMFIAWALVPNVAAAVATEDVESEFNGEKHAADVEP